MYHLNPKRRKGRKKIMWKAPRLLKNLEILQRTPVDGRERPGGGNLGASGPLE
jgi:hypothetical protein